MKLLTVLCSTVYRENAYSLELFINHSNAFCTMSNKLSHWQVIIFAAEPLCSFSWNKNDGLLTVKTFRIIARFCKYACGINFSPGTDVTISAVSILARELILQFLQYRWYPWETVLAVSVCHINSVSGNWKWKQLILQETMVENLLALSI
jgi:hypothetical protein